MQGAYSRDYLAVIPGRQRIRKRVEELLAVEVVSEPWKVRNRYFFCKRKAFQEQPAIMMRDCDSNKDVVLVTPAIQREGIPSAVKILNISMDGNLVAYVVQGGGGDSRSVELFDVNRMQVLPDRLPLGFGPGLVFSQNGRGFYYCHEVIDSPRPHYRAVWWHEFGSNPNTDIEIFFAG